MSGKAVLTVGAVLRGDDAAGPMLSKMLETNPVAGWTNIDGGQMPEDQLAVVRRMAPDMLLLVDAADMGAAPGTIAVLDEHDVAASMLFTTHSLPISFLLKELKSCCGRVVFLGIQPGQLEFMAPLTPQVNEAVEKIYGMLATGSGYAAGIPGEDGYAG